VAHKRARNRKARAPRSGGLAAMDPAAVRAAGDDAADFNKSD
jgi:hypothetical protein